MNFNRWSIETKYDGSVVDNNRARLSWEIIKADTWPVDATAFNFNGVDAWQGP